MGVASRRIAWSHDRKAPFGKVLGLFALETLCIIAWTTLVAAFLRLLVGHCLHFLPPVYVLSVAVAALLESSGEGARLNPMTAAGLSSFASADGSNPGTERRFVRLFLTPPALLVLGAGVLPVLGGHRSIPEKLSGVRIFEVDVDIDPRPPRTIRTQRRDSLVAVLSCVLAASGVASLVLLTTPDAPLVEPDIPGGDTHRPALPPEERVLLADYLALSAQFPDSLRFHVRLASLYYRNDMTVDFAAELEEIRRLDPEHPLLLLEEDVVFDDLIEPSETYEPPLGEPAALAPAGYGTGDESTPDSSFAGDSTTLAPPTPTRPDSAPPFPSPPGAGVDGGFPEGIPPDSSGGADSGGVDSTLSVLPPDSPGAFPDEGPPGPPPTPGEPAADPEENLEENAGTGG